MLQAAQAPSRALQAEDFTMSQIAVEQFGGRQYSQNRTIGALVKHLHGA
jgi:hypothetical protein